MVSQGEEEVQQALEEILKLYDIKLEDLQGEEDEIRGDYSQIISKTQDKLDDLNEKAEEIFQNTGMTKEQLEAYSANPNNFTKEQWEALQKVKAACETYQNEALSRIHDPEFNEKSVAQKRKKQPQRFAKKKNWIPL